MTRTALWAGVLLLAACADATPPERPQPYGFGIPYDQNLTLVFHWTPASLPVRIWVQSQNDIPHHVRNAIDEWERHARYGEFRAQLVDDSTRADVIVSAGRDDSMPQTGELACGGVTRIEVNLDTTISLPFHTRLDVRVGATQDATTTCLAAVAMHELGVTLGMFLPSPDSGDVMYPRPTATQLSARDDATFRALYHTAPTVRLPPGR